MWLLLKINQLKCKITIENRKNGWFSVFGWTHNFIKNDFLAQLYTVMRLCLRFWFEMIVLLSSMRICIWPEIWLWYWEERVVQPPFLRGSPRWDGYSRWHDHRRWGQHLGRYVGRQGSREVRSQERRSAGKSKVACSERHLLLLRRRKAGRTLHHHCKPRHRSGAASSDRCCV